MTAQDTGAAASETWPALPVEEWAATRDTLHMWTQVIGKIRLALAPMVNHWWQVPLYVSPRGLSTSAIPSGTGLFDMEFDFIGRQLHLRSSTGDQRRINLEPKSVAAFYDETLAALRALGLKVAIRPSPVEVERAVPFHDDTEYATYDPEHAHRFWGQLLQAHRVINDFRSRFIGKVSPVHFFWGGFDLACTRFSGNSAPRHPGGAPNCGDWVMVEGYSHELSSCGFWPGGSAEGTFYAYAYPEPAGFAAHPVGPAEAYYSRENGQFLLPYAAVRTAPDPDQALLEFLQSSYEAAAKHGGWNRDALEGDPARRANPR